MGYPKLVVYVRHGESEGNVMTREEIHRARIPVHAFDLTERGRQQARVTGDYLRDRFGKFDMHFVSTYSRTYETLKNTGLKGPFLEDSRIDETHFGIHHFYPRDELEARFPVEPLRQEILGDYWYRPFGGQNWPDYELQIHSFLDMLRRDWSGKKVCVFSHGNKFAAWKRVVERASINEMMRLRGPLGMKNCEVATYVGMGPWYAPWNRNELVATGRVTPWHDGYDVYGK